MNFFFYKLAFETVEIRRIYVMFFIFAAGNDCWYMEYGKRKNIAEYRALLKLGLPIVAGQLGMIVLGFADTMMVGRYGTDELGAAAFVNNMFNLVIVFATGFSYGLTPVVGGFFGRGEHGAIGRILKNALFVNFLAAAGLVAVMGVLYLNLHRLGQPQELLPLMRPYFLVLSGSVFFVLLFNAFRQFADGITDTVTPMFILLGGNLFNLIGNYVLINGKAGFPELGLLGAGVATFAARMLMALCFAAVFFFTGKYRTYRQGFMEGRCNRKDAGLLCRLGLPVGLQMGMETASFSLSTVMVGWLGTVALAAHQVMLTIGQLGFMMYYGLAAAVAVRTSVSYGRGDLSGTKDTAGAGFHLILALAVAVSSCILLFRNEIGFLFTGNPDVVATVAGLVIPFAVYQFGDGMQCNYSNALRGISDVKMVTLYAFAAYFLISLPAGWFLAFVCGLGLTGIWLSYTLGLTSAGLMFMFRFRKSLYRIID